MTEGRPSDLPVGLTLTLVATLAVTACHQAMARAPGVDGAVERPALVRTG